MKGKLTEVGKKFTATIIPQQVYQNPFLYQVNVLSYRRHSISDYIQGEDWNMEDKQNREELQNSSSNSGSLKEIKTKNLDAKKNILNPLINKEETCLKFDLLTTTKEQVEMERLYHLAIQDYINLLYQTKNKSRFQNPMKKAEYFYSPNTNKNIENHDPNFVHPFLLRLNEALDGESHIILLMNTLTKFPKSIPNCFRSSEPWCYYWVLHALDILGVVKEGMITSVEEDSNLLSKKIKESKKKVEKTFSTSSDTDDIKQDKGKDTNKQQLDYAKPNDDNNDNNNNNSSNDNKYDDDDDYSNYFFDSLIEESMNLSQTKKDRLNKVIERDNSLLKDARIFLEDHLRKKILIQLERYYNPLLGGYGGGIGQDPHILSTYAALSSLQILKQRVDLHQHFPKVNDEIKDNHTDGDGYRNKDGDGEEGINKENKRSTHLYKFLLSCKNKNDGSFRASPHSDAESDIRICYGALASAVYIDKLNLRWRHQREIDQKEKSTIIKEIKEGLDLVNGCVEYIASLQTLEGGFSNERFSMEDMIEPAKLCGEAHAGFTYTAVASLAILDKFYSGIKGSNILKNKSKGESEGKPKEHCLNLDLDVVDLPEIVRDSNGSVWDAIDRMKLLEWCRNRQTYEGGFNGRCNKLVDSCYSFWLCATIQIIHDSFRKEKENEIKKEEEENLEEKIEPLPFPLYDSQALAEYILLVAQVRQAFPHTAKQVINQKRKRFASAGGFRDKPPMLPDYYHTCYALSGLALSLSQPCHKEEKDQIRTIDPVFNLCINRTRALYVLDP